MREFHWRIEGFLQEEGLDYDKWEFIRAVGETYQNWRRRPH